MTLLPLNWILYIFVHHVVMKCFSSTKLLLNCLGLGYILHGFFGYEMSLSIKLFPGLFVFIFPCSRILPQKHKCPPLPIMQCLRADSWTGLLRLHVSSFCGCVTVCCMRSEIPAVIVSRFCHTERQFGSHHACLWNVEYGPLIETKLQKRLIWKMAMVIMAQPPLYLHINVCSAIWLALMNDAKLCYHVEVICA